MPQSTIGRIEAGSIDPRVGTLSRLLRACGFDLDVTERIGQGIDRTLMRPTPPDRAEERLRRIGTEAGVDRTSGWLVRKAIEEFIERHRASKRAAKHPPAAAEPGKNANPAQGF